MEKNTSRCLTQKAPYKGLGADSEEKREPASDVDTALVDSLKALDANRPIREADIHRIGAALADQFDLARPPGLGEERFERAVEAKARDKTFTGHGLNPVA